VPALQGDPGRTLSLWDLDDRRLQASAFVMNAVKDVLKREAFSPPSAPLMLVSLRVADSPQPQLQDPCRLVCGCGSFRTAHPTILCACSCC
jgi:hypothetical protein